MKKNFRKTIFIILLLLNLNIMCSCSGTPKLTIKNVSDEEILKVRIEYNNSIETIKSIDIGTIKINDVFVHEIDEKMESSIKLIFYDSLDKRYEEIVVGYVYQGVSGENVTIKKNSEGKFIFEQK